MADRSPEDLADLLTLCDVSGVGVTRFSALMRHFGSPKAVLGASVAELETVPGIAPSVAAAIAGATPSDETLRQCDRIMEAGISVLACTDSDYPEHLAALDDAPPLLFVRGNAGLLALQGVAIVGTRRPSEYGRHVTGTLVRRLVERGVTIISGMARGVDSLAHKVALSRGGATVAVLGCGVDVVYPPEAYQLHSRIAAEGALVSELWLGTPPDRTNFPRRNRIISGLSRAVVITEAPAKSGALITAELALQQNRDLYAVPGDITRPEAQGVNELIASVAQAITSPEDLLLRLGLAARISASPEDALGLPVAAPHDLSEDERRILESLQIEPLHIDALAAKLGRDPSALLTDLTLMEMRGLVKTHPGSCYSRAVVAS